MEKMVLYNFKREGGRSVFVPTPAFARLMVGMFCAGSLLMLYLSSIFFRHGGDTSADLWIGAIFVLVAGYSATLASRAWRTRSIPLSIETSGRVSYGEMELCAAGTVRSVRIAQPRFGEGDCEVALELAGGELVFIPSLYFPVFAVRVQARAFAMQLAEVLRVAVTVSS